MSENRAPAASPRTPQHRTPAGPTQRHSRRQSPPQLLDRIPAGLDMYRQEEDPLRRAWEEFVLPHIDPYDRDHYETVWAAVVRRGPTGDPFPG